jgi:hypothetical protein
MDIRNSRREFLGRAAAAVMGAGLFPKRTIGRQAPDPPALLGGTPVHKGSWPA